MGPQRLVDHGIPHVDLEVGERIALDPPAERDDHEIRPADEAAQLRGHLVGAIGHLGEVAHERHELLGRHAGGLEAVGQLGQALAGPRRHRDAGTRDQQPGDDALAHLAGATRDDGDPAVEARGIVFVVAALARLGSRGGAANDLGGALEHRASLERDHI